MPITAHGNVIGPITATDGAIVVYDGTTGQLVKNTGVTIDASNNVAGILTLTATNLAGTLTTAAQPNITSLGTLTLLNVNGDTTTTIISGSNDWPLVLRNDKDPNGFDFQIAGENNLIFNESGLGAYFENTNGTIQINQYTSNGSLTVGSGNGTIVSSSDARIKTEPTLMTYGVDECKQLRGVMFEYLADPGTPRGGLIAQEVELVIPEAVDGKKIEYKWEVEDDGETVKTDDNGDIVYRLDSEGEQIIRPRGLDLNPLVGMLINTCNEQQTVIEDLKSRLELLEVA